ncbi:conjugal transfer protein TrbL family protein [Actinomycetes bacterium KLBMP 9797]
MVDDIIRGLGGVLLDGLTAVTLWALTWALDLLSGSMFRSPDVTVLPQVIHLSGRARFVANACLVLAVMVAGILAMVRGGGVQERYTVKDLLPRLVVGFTVANFSTPVLSFVIEAANAVTAALSAQFGAQDDGFGQLRRVIMGGASSPQHAIVVVVVRELALFLLVALLFTWLGRVAVLLVLAGTAPIALACHSFEFTEVVARLWWRSLLGALAVQVLQATALNMAVGVLLTPGANLPALGLPHDPTGLLNLLIAVFVLWVVVRIPKWLSRHVGLNQNRAASTLGHIVRVILVQQALRAAGLVVGSRRLATRAAGLRLPPNHFHQHAAGQHLHQHVHIHPGRDGRVRRGSTDGEPSARRAHATVGRGRPHGGRQPLALGPGPTGRPSGGGSAPGGSGSGGGGARRPVPTPDAMPLKRPRWQAYGARPSGTGWPADPPPRPAAGQAPRASGTGWPSRPASPAASPGRAGATGTGWPAAPPARRPAVAEPAQAGRLTRRPTGTGWPSVPRAVPRPRRGGHSGG